jgi:hypothetical protein
MTNGKPKDSSALEICYAKPSYFSIFAGITIKSNKDFNHGGVLLSGN